ncbi:MAG: hydroxymethylglutaryl-CoA reductase, degradative [Spirochaeta sp.]|jgi:hydroxymethylglutaryl-CoA reductase|nr:hydroxymethylglutaryl-CoA reductase, degradative [Spirochaeta sp.]
MADTAYELGEDTPELPVNFRKLTPREKRRVLSELLDIEPTELHSSNPAEDLIDLADVMVESAVGVMPVPLGIASGIRIDGEVYNVPMAVEEPSVIAAATYAGRLVSRGDGGFHTTTTGQVMTAQIAIDDAAPGSKERILQAERELHRDLTSLLDPMTRRGGGYRGIDVSEFEESGLVVVYLHVDTRDAMGANIINTAAETLRGPLERISGGTVLMAILTNAAPRRRARACFSIPVAGLGRGTFDGATMARRVVRANQFADTDPLRAVTHNKGIMNGITSVALATGNDTRAIEAAAHAHAVRDGAYRALTEYRIDDERLVGSLELPLAMGTVGGAVGFHPVSSFALKVLFLSPDIEVSADRLSRITVSIGLAQNLAALLALVGEGIQKGHMRQHSRRLAWKAGARDEEIQELAQRVWSHGTFNIETAQELLHELRRER